MAHSGDEFGDVVGVHDVGTLGVDDFALFVGDVVVFEQVFARVEVVRFYFALRAFDLFGDHARFDGFVFAHAEALHHARHALAGEDADEVVVEGDVEAAGAGVALAAGAATELVVDTARFVAFGANDVQATGGDNGFVALLPVVAHRLFGFFGRVFAERVQFAAQ